MASAGVFQPRVLRGLVFNARATALWSSRECRESSVPLGKYWRSSPLAFSLVPRCHSESLLSVRPGFGPPGDEHDVGN